MKIYQNRNGYYFVIRHNSDIATYQFGSMKTLNFTRTTGGDKLIYKEVT